MKAETLRAVVVNNADTKSKPMTDERRTYTAIGRRFTGHGTINHAEEEWARGETRVNREAWPASINIAASSTFTDTSLSSISDIRTASSSGLTILSALAARSRALPAKG